MKAAPSRPVNHFAVRVESIETSDSYAILLRNEKLRALILRRLEDQPPRLESTRTVIVR